MAKKESKEVENKDDKKTTKTTKKEKESEKKSEEKDIIDNLVKNTTKITNSESRDMNEMISVISIVDSKLIYNSKAQQGYRIEWGEFLEENWIEYKELIAMRNTQKTFFERPWVICEMDVLEDLRVSQYYKNLIDIENLDSVFEKSPDELESILTKVPKGIQELIISRACTLIENKELDSLNLIETIKRVCKIDFMV